MRVKFTIKNKYTTYVVQLHDSYSHKNCYVVKAYLLNNLKSFLYYDYHFELAEASQNYLALAKSIADIANIQFSSYTSNFNLISEDQ